MYRLKPALPWIALVAAIVALICFIITTSTMHPKFDEGQTNPIVLTALQPVLEQHPSTLDDTAFRGALDDFSRSQYVVYVWLVDTRGQIIYSNSRFANAGTVAQHATDETRRILSILPADTLTDDEKIAILAASAIQSEGEHNDIYRQLLQPVSIKEGELIGWVGASYEASASSSQVGWGYISALLLWLLGTGVYWLSLPAWVWLDARERGDRALVWAFFVFMGNLVALLAYILTRLPKKITGES